MTLTPTPSFPLPTPPYFQHPELTPNTQTWLTSSAKRWFWHRERDNFNNYHRNSGVTIHNNTLEVVWESGEVSFYLHNYWHQPFRVVNDSATHTDRTQRRTQPKLSHACRTNSSTHAESTQPRTQVQDSHAHKSTSSTHTDYTQPYTQRKVSHTHTDLYMLHLM